MWYEFSPSFNVLAISNLFSSDPIYVGYQSQMYTTTETEGSVPLCAVVFNRPDGAPRQFTVHATTANGLAS